MKIILLFLTLLFLACSKEVKTTLDESPQFSFGSQEVKISSIEPLEVFLKRGEKDDGPTLEIFINKKQNIIRTERSIFCSQYEFKGKAYNNNDPRIFSFKISDSEFEQIQNLPSKAECKLVVKLENENGSTAKKEIKIKFNFDKPQVLEVSKNSALRGALDHSAKLLPLDIISIKNPFTYPVGVKYVAESNCVGFTAIRNSVNNRLDASMQYGALKTFQANIIKLSGNYDFKDGDYRAFVNFTIKAQESVSIATYSNALTFLPDKVLHNTAMGSSEMPITGAYINYCVDHYDRPGLYLWSDIEKTYTEPVKYFFPPGSIGVIPGLGRFY
ncbi:MAG: hypothetical protein IPM57_09810 [Oligoflexia bacterium]|nr:hypothetical protein [Oligoflexia bacterium]